MKTIKSYVDSFSYEWTTFKDTQLDSHSKLGESRRSLTRTLNINLEELKDKIVLDAGCGTGRHIEVIAPYCETVVGVDLSDSVKTAQMLVGGLCNVFIVRADLNRLPFKQEVFDWVYSIGVLHHTPNTHTSFLNLLPCLKYGGWIAVWVYTSEGLLWRAQWPFHTFIRFFIQRLPHRLALLCCCAAIPLYWVYKICPLVRVVFPFAPHPQWRHRVLDTFDSYTPKYSHKQSASKVVGWYEAAGLCDVEVTIGGVNRRGTHIGSVWLTVESPAVKGRKSQLINSEAAPSA